MTQVVSFECYRWYHLSDIIIIGKNKPEYATIQETGLSNLPETMLRDLVAKYLVR